MSSKSNIQLEPIHVTYQGGSRGDFLATLLAIAHDPSRCEKVMFQIKPEGVVHNGMCIFNSFWHCISDLNSGITLEKIKACQTKRLYSSDNIIGNSHLLTFIPAGKSNVKDVLINNKVIVIRFNENEIDELYSNWYRKNLPYTFGLAQQSETIQKHYNVASRLILEHIDELKGPDTMFVDHNTILSDYGDIIKSVGQFTGISLHLNPLVHKFAKKYKELQ